MSSYEYSIQKTTNIQSSTRGGFPSTEHAAEAFVAATENEKKDLQGLNQRLEVYIGRVKSLESTNQKLIVELDQLRGSLGTDIGNIKYKYHESLTSVRRDISESSKGTINVEVRVNRLRDDLNDYRNRYEEARREAEREKKSWSGAIAQAEAELNSSKTRYATVLEEEKRLYAEQEGLYNSLATAKDELDETISERLRLQQQEESLKNEIHFLARVQSQEIEELRSLLTQAPADTRDFFKNELALAIRDIKAEYDEIINTTKLDLEAIFQSKISTFEESVSRSKELSDMKTAEITKLNKSITELRSKLSILEAKNAQLDQEASNIKHQLVEDQRSYEHELAARDNQLRCMREDCQTLIAELQSLLNTKQTLDAEIAIYRKLVECEEGRVGKLVVETDYFESGSSQTTYKRHAKGDVSIYDSDSEGRYIIIKNASSVSVENISNFKIQRIIDGVVAFTYTIPHNTVIHPKGCLKIYGQNSDGIHSPPETIIMNHPSWGTGNVVETKLFNSNNVEKATYIQTRVVNH